MVASINMIITTRKIVRNSRRLRGVKEEVLSLRQEKNQLIQEINDKETQEYIEKTAREELNLVKPDEEIYIYPEEKDMITKKTGVNRARSFQKHGTPFQQWVELIFK